MFDEENIDSLFKSALEDAQEEVPAGVWESVSSGLDKIAQRRKARFVLTRAVPVLCAAAAAAAIAVVPAFRKDAGDIIPEDGIIAMSYDRQQENGDSTAVLVADVIPIASPATYHGSLRTASAAKSAINDCSTVMEEGLPAMGADESIEETDGENVIAAETYADDRTKDTSLEKGTDKQETFTGEFDGFSNDESDGRRRIKASIGLSGLTTTGNTAKPEGVAMLKRPSIATSKLRTGVTENSTTSAFGIPVSVGVDVKIDFAKRWAVSAGLRYTLLTRKSFGTYIRTDSEGNEVWSETSDFRNTQHYVGIPVNVYFDIVSLDFMKFYANAGGSVEKCFLNSYQMLGSTTIHREPVKGVQWSLDAGVGVEFIIGKHLGLYLDPSFRYYFPGKEQPTSIRTASPYNFGIEAGLRIRL